MEEPPPAPRDSTPVAAASRQPETVPAHYAVVALLWLVIPVAGVPAAIVTGAMALLARNGKTRLSDSMASVAIVLAIAESVYFWLRFT